MTLHGKSLSVENLIPIQPDVTAKYWEKDEEIYSRNSSWYYSGRRDQLRAVLEIPTGSLLQAHHVIPVKFSSHPIVQAAAKYKNNPFHMNSKENGWKISLTQHKANHLGYENVVQAELDRLARTLPGLDPKTCSEQIERMISKLKQGLSSNTTNLDLNIIW